MFKKRVNDPSNMLACWGNVVSMKYLSNKRAEPPPPKKAHRFFVTDFISLQKDNINQETRDAYSYKHILDNCSDPIDKDYNEYDMLIAKKIFRILLEDVLFGYKTIYTNGHYKSLLLKIVKLISKRKPLKFVLPGFVAKCPKRDRDVRVFGSHADFAEFLAIRTLIETIHKIKELYPEGVTVTIITDPQTFDNNNEICTLDCELYQNDLEAMICYCRAGDIIKLISLDEYKKDVEPFLDECIRISLYHHHPVTENYPLDLYKKYNCSKGGLRTPWRHVVMFDSFTGDFNIDRKSYHVKESLPNAPVFTVSYDYHKWLLLKLNYTDINDGKYPANNEIEISMLRYGKGVMIENRSGVKLNSAIIKVECLASMIKEFGVVILRGFYRNENEDDIDDFYSTRGSLDLICVMQMNSDEPIVIEYIRLRLEPELVRQDLCLE